MTATTRWVATAIILEVLAVILFCIAYNTNPNVQFNGLTLLAIILVFGGMIIGLVKGD